jgi:DinB superfamily
MPEPKKKLAELLAYMDQQRAALFATAGHVTPSFATIRPRDGNWSSAEIVAHLALVEDGIGRLISKAIKKAREEGVGADTSDESVMSSLEKYDIIENPRKLTAPTTITPTEPRPVEESLAALQQSRAKLREVLISGSDIDLAAVKRPHPVLGDLNVYEWALFVAQHEERHRRQIERTLNEVTELCAECAPIV